MGWTYQESYNKEDTMRNHEWEAVQYTNGVTAKILAKEWRPKTFYAIIEVTPKDAKSYRFLRVDTIDWAKDGNGFREFGYKDMSEEMGPVVTDHPTREFAKIVWELLPNPEENYASATVEDREGAFAFRREVGIPTSEDEYKRLVKRLERTKEFANNKIPKSSFERRMARMLSRKRKIENSWGKWADSTPGRKVALEEFKKMDEEARLSAANSPTLTPDLSFILAHCPDKKILTSIAKNENAGWRALQHLARCKHKDVRAAVVLNNATDSITLAILSNDKEDTIRFNVIQHKNAESALLGDIAKSDPLPEIRQVAKDKLERRANPEKTAFDVIWERNETENFIPWEARENQHAIPKQVTRN